MQNKKNFRRKRFSRREFYVPGIPRGVKIPDGSPQALEMGLKYLKRQMKDAGIVQTLRGKQYHVKPSTARRKLKDDAIRKQQLHDKITKRFWKDYVWLLPPSKGDNIGPNLPDCRDSY